MAIVNRQIATCDAEAELADLSLVAGQESVCLDTGNKFLCDGAAHLLIGNTADKAKLDSVSDGATAPDEASAVLAVQIFSR